MADPARAALLADLAADPARVAELSPTDAPAVLAEMSALQLAVAARLAAANGTPSSGDDRLLTPDEVATLLQKPRHSIYSLARRADWKAFTVRINAKTLRFREVGLRRWMTRLINRR